MSGKMKVIIAIGVIALAALVIGIPILIAGTDNPGCLIWDVSIAVGATDWLSFYGSIVSALLGAGIAIAGVWWTLRENQRQYHQDQINQTLPYFIARYYHHKSNFHPLLSVFAPKHKEESIPQISEAERMEDIQYQEYLRNDVCLILSHGTQEWKTDFSEDQWQIIRQGGFYNKKTDENKSSIYHTNLVYAKIEFENVGKGTATFVEIGLNKKDVNHNYVTIPAKKIGESLIVRILATDCCEQDEGQYDLDIMYLDIYQRAYRQRYPLTIEKREEYGYCCSLSFDSNQEAFNNWKEMIQSEQTPMHEIHMNKRLAKMISIVNEGKMIKRKMVNKLQMWFSFPQVKLFCGISLLTGGALFAAIVIQDSFWSSIASNVFAGLLTGLVLALLSGTRQIYLARQEEQLNWLEGLLSTLQKYTRIHQNLVRNKGKDEDRFNCAYDILCIGNEAVEYLRWNPDNKTLGFDPYVYCKQNYGIDLNVMKEHSQNLHERLINEDFPADNHSVWEWFREFDHDLHQLYNAVEKDIQNHKILLATAKRTII